MIYKKYLVLIPGIILAFILYTLSQGINNIVGIELMGYTKSPISTAMIAILFGMLFGNIFKIREIFLKGLDFTQKNILKLGIICLGIQLKPFAFLEFGKIAIPLIIICIVSVLLVIKLISRKIIIPKRMSYLLSMLIYPYFANFYFNGESLFIGLFLGTAIHETAQVAAAGLIYDQQFNSPETLNISTVTKLIRNTFLIIMIPLFAYLYSRGQIKQKKYSIISIFPYFVLGFIAMIILRNLGDNIFLVNQNEIWLSTIENIKFLSKIFLTMAMAAIGLSTNLREIKNMGYRPFLVGFVAMATVGLISIITIEIFINYII